MTQEGAPHHSFSLDVVDADLDELGHVNNARYLDYLERGRTGWYDEAELVAKCAGTAAREDLGTVVVNVNIDFRSECVGGDALIVRTMPARAGTKSFRVAQRIEKVSGELAAEASVTSVIMDLKTRVAVPLSDGARTLFPAS